MSSMSIRVRTPSVQKQQQFANVIGRANKRRSGILDADTSVVANSNLLIGIEFIKDKTESCTKKIQRGLLREALKKRLKIPYVANDWKIRDKMGFLNWIN